MNDSQRVRQVELIRTRCLSNIEEEHSSGSFLWGFLAVMIRITMISPAIFRRSTVSIWMSREKMNNGRERKGEKKNNN